MDIKYNLDEIKEILIEELEIVPLNTAMKKLRQEFDFTPWGEDDDEYVGFWAEMQHNMDLINDVIYAVVQTLEAIVVGARELQGPEKLDVAVSVLDEALDLPWYAEMFDGPMLKLVVSQAVSLMNSVDWGPMGEVTDTQQLGDSFVKFGANEDGKLDVLPMIAERRGI